MACEPCFGADLPLVMGEGTGRRPARLLNVSAWGIALEMTEPAESGAELRIELPECVASGAVAYCRPVAGSYFVGVKLDFALDSIVRLALHP